MQPASYDDLAAKPTCFNDRHVQLKTQWDLKRTKVLLLLDARVLLLLLDAMTLLQLVVCLPLPILKLP